MLKATWRRLGSPAWLAIILVFLLPTLAQAQLFPNRTIRRERPPCASEPPFNAQVRRDYFGYYPTCWTRFPAGWACPCPNPELPSMERSIRENGPIGQKRTSPDGELPRGMDDENPDAPGEGMPARPGGENPIPLPNPGRSPFDLDPSPKPPGTAPGTDPFTTPGPTAPGGRAPNSTGLLEMPKLPETAPSTSFESPLKPGSMTTAPEATLTSSDTSDLRPDLGPLPSAPLPEPSTPPVAVSVNNPPVAAAPFPAQAPKRRGFFSSLFRSKNSNNP